jgi:hypothetical protein
MTKTKWILGGLLLVFIISQFSKTNEESSSPEENIIEVDNVPEILLGVYHGIQDSYFMKNKFGDDLIVNGQKINVPSVDHRFLFEKQNAVSLQQTNLEDNSRVYYEGSFKILSEENGLIKIECALSDGEYSNPKYILELNKSEAFMTFKETSGGAPSFNLDHLE